MNPPPTWGAHNDDVWPGDFAAFYRAEFVAIALVAGATAGSRTDGEDIAQEAFARAEQRWPEIAEMDKPGAWVRRVAINLALNRRRRFGREAAALTRLAGRRESHAATPDGADPRHGDPEIWAAIDRLAPRQRAVITLHYFEERSVHEIAEILDCSISAATSNLYKARKRLAAILGGGVR